jgi:hypothetical protein
MNSMSTYDKTKLDTNLIYMEPYRQVMVEQKCDFCNNTDIYTEHFDLKNMIGLKYCESCKKHKEHSFKIFDQKNIAFTWKIFGLEKDDFAIIFRTTTNELQKVKQGRGRIIGEVTGLSGLYTYVKWFDKFGIIYTKTVPLYELMYHTFGTNPPIDYEFIKKNFYHDGSDVDRYIELLKNEIKKVNELAEYKEENE